MHIRWEPGPGRTAKVAVGPRAGAGQPQISANSPALAVES